MVQTPPQKPEPPSAERPKDWSGLYLGLEFGLTAIGGVALGFWIGKKFNMQPVGIIVGLFVGAIVGTYNLARALK